MDSSQEEAECWGLLREVKNLDELRRQDTDDATTLFAGQIVNSLDFIHITFVLPIRTFTSKFWTIWFRKLIYLHHTIKTKSVPAVYVAMGCSLKALS
jgi:hypothetical protein